MMNISDDDKVKVNFLQNKMKFAYHYTERFAYENELKTIYKSLIVDNIENMEQKKLMYILYFMDKLDQAFVKLEQEDLESMFKNSEKIEIIIKK